MLRHQEALQVLEEKPIFETRLNVIRVRANYSGPYRKCKFFAITKADLKDKRAFTKHILTIAKNWPTGTYYLKNSLGKIFVRFDILNGKISKIYDKSPITGREYDWVYFLKTKKKK